MVCNYPLPLPLPQPFSVGAFRKQVYLCVNFTPKQNVGFTVKAAESEKYCNVYILRHSRLCLIMVDGISSLAYKLLYERSFGPGGAVAKTTVRKLVVIPERAIFAYDKTFLAGERKRERYTGVRGTLSHFP